MSSLRGSAAALGLAFGLSNAASAQDLERGEQLYDKWCAECHGFEGEGDGAAAAYMLPPPRDFTLALYQLRTTPSGALPRDEDLVRVIEEGMPGTSMPGWKTKFNDSQIRDLIAYLKTFSRFFQIDEPPEPYEFGRPPGLSDEGLAEGREFYEKIECYKCHGDAGRGDGNSAPTLQDDLDFPIRAADLSENWFFNGGGRVEDIFRRLRTGMDGTPMPTFSDLLDSGFMTEEQLWHLAQYVRSLAPEKPPQVREVIRAVRIEGPLPASPDDSLWAEIERFYIPLVGQIIEEPRWFAPTVDGAYVNAVHNDEEIALRVVWHDPSESPDPGWLEWQQRVALTLFPLQDSTGVELLPDRLTVQFPSEMPTGRAWPYLFMGDPRRPAYLWSWSSDSDEGIEARATGLGTTQSQPAGSQTLTTVSTWDRGEWRLQFQRSLATADSANELQFQTGVAIPIAFLAWDGSNGEQGKQGSVGSWYSIYLETPTPPTVYVSPVVAILLTAGLGLLVIWRAQRREGTTSTVA